MPRTNLTLFQAISTLVLAVWGTEMYIGGPLGTLADQPEDGDRVFSDRKLSGK